MAGTFQPRTYADFEKQYRLIQQFGDKRVEQILRNRADNQGQTAKPTVDLVNDLFSKIDTKYNNFSKAIEKALRAENLPRGDLDPNLANRDKLDVNPQLQNRAQHKMPSWAKNIDPGVSPNQAFQNVINSLNQPGARGDQLLTSFKNALEKDKNELKNKLKARLAMPGPAPSRKIEPRPY